MPNFNKTVEKHLCGILQKASIMLPDAVKKKHNGCNGEFWLLLTLHFT